MRRPAGVRRIPRGKWLRQLEAMQVEINNLHYILSEEANVASTQWEKDRFEARCDWLNALYHDLNQATRFLSK